MSGKEVFMSKESINTMVTKAKVAVIVLDSGFTRDSVARVKNLLGYYDLNTGICAVGQPMVGGEARELVLHVAQDPLNHGSIILDRLLDFDSELPVVLVRAFAPQGGLIRTRFEQGIIASAGWTEAYLWAQNLCVQKGYFSVANCSFGGFHQALDGSGWESFQLAQVVGPGKPGHLVAAAAGPGDGRAIHASLTLPGGQTEVIHSHQDGPSTYNLLLNRLSQEGRVEDQVKGDESRAGGSVVDFDLQVKINGWDVLACRGKDLVPNLWNGKQQFTFEVDGVGDVQFAISLAPGPTARFDMFISREEGARFSNFIDSELVSEPAILSEVIAVGLEGAAYGSCHVKGIAKPELLLSGPGPISFRTPEVTFALTRLLADNPALDLPAARAELQGQAGQ
jgi:hypothetical protein